MLTTITRKHGTNCHTAPTVEDFVTACLDVLENGYAKINTCTMDSTTAGMVKAVWEKLNTHNREVLTVFWNKRYAMDPAFAVTRTVDLFWKCLK